MVTKVEQNKTYIYYTEHEQYFVYYEIFNQILRIMRWVHVS